MRLNQFLARSGVASRRGADELIRAGRVRVNGSVGELATAVSGRDVALTPLEYRLLVALVRHSGQVLSPEQLLELVWGDEGASRDQVKLYVGYLRRKLGPEAAAAVETVRGFGYRYRPPGAGAQAG